MKNKQKIIKLIKRELEAGKGYPLIFDIASKMFIPMFILLAIFIVVGDIKDIPSKTLWMAFPYSFLVVLLIVLFFFKPKNAYKKSILWQIGLLEEEAAIGPFLIAVKDKLEEMSSNQLFKVDVILYEFDKRKHLIYKKLDTYENLDMNEKMSRFKDELRKLELDLKNISIKLIDKKLSIDLFIKKSEKIMNKFYEENLS